MSGNTLTVLLLCYRAAASLAASADVAALTSAVPNWRQEPNEGPRGSNTMIDVRGLSSVVTPDDTALACDWTSTVKAPGGTEEHSHLIFSTTSKGELALELVVPGGSMVCAMSEVDIEDADPETVLTTSTTYSTVSMTGGKDTYTGTFEPGATGNVPLSGGPLATGNVPWDMKSNGQAVYMSGTGPIVFPTGAFPTGTASSMLVTPGARRTIEPKIDNMASPTGSSAAAAFGMVFLHLLFDMH